MRPFWLGLMLTFAGCTFEPAPQAGPRASDETSQPVATEPQRLQPALTADSGGASAPQGQKPAAPAELLASAEPEDLIKRSRHYGAMGTEILLEVYGLDGADLDRALDEAVLEIDRLDRKMTSWDNSSELSSINLAAGKAPVVVSEELFSLIDRALYCSELTGGAFDISYASAGVDLWNYKNKQNPKLPSPEAVAAAKAKIGWKKVVLDKDAKSVFLAEEGMKIDLGGIAKGYALERVAEIFKRHNLGVYMIKAGGDMRMHGKKNGQPWRIGIKDPRRPGELFAVVPVANVSLSTSGDYERFVEIDGVRYHHIIDPRTAMPSRGTASVTVFSKNAELADALSTGLFVLGPEEGLALANRIREVEAIIVDDSLRVHLSSGLQVERP